ncbi:MAG: hypothetical protein H7Z16_12580 [Pyrinomonadaceae bacterium]|nr:hypothetical protein [Pyrinomonadaceae bacterium]
MAKIKTTANGRRYVEIAGVIQRRLDQLKASRNGTNGSLILKVITTVASAVYAGWFLWDLIWARIGTSSIVSVDWNVAESPQFVISILLVTATAALWILREKHQGFSAVLFFAGIAYAVYHWWKFTSQIRTNTGLAGLTWLSNTFIGASWFDALALVAIFSLLGFAISSLGSARSHQHQYRLKTSTHS